MPTAIRGAQGRPQRAALYCGEIAAASLTSKMRETTASRRTARTNTETVLSLAREKLIVLLSSE